MSPEPTPENNLILRQMVGMRRDMAETRETNARVIELLGRANVRLDEMTARFDDGLGRLDRRLREMQGDLVLMENRVITAIAEVRTIAARMDQAQFPTDGPTAPEQHG